MYSPSSRSAAWNPPRTGSYATSPYQVTSESFSQVQPACDYYGPAPNQTLGRTQFSLGQDESPAYYNVPSSVSPAYMLPNNVNGFYGSAASPKHWNYSSSMRQQHGTAYPDTAPSSVIGPSANSYIGTPSPGEVSCTFPSVSSVISASTASSDRILPDPNPTRCYAGATSLGDSIADHQSLGSAAYRLNNLWSSADVYGNENRLRIAHDSAGRPGNPSEPPDVGFGFAPASQNPKTFGQSATSSRPANTNTTSSAFGGSITSAANGALSTTSEISADSSTAESYGYSTESRIRRGSAADAIPVGALSNGEPYTRVPPLTSSYPQIRHSGHGFGAQNRGTSTPSLSNSTGY